MATVSKEAVDEALKTVKYPGFSRDILSFGLVRSVEVEGATAKVRLSVTTADESIPAKIKSDVEAALRNVEGVQQVEAHVAVSAPKGAPAAAATSSATGPAGPGGSPARFAIAVASGKGGVGKSTVAVNLACALEQLLRKDGKKVGLLDCDLYGPSIPLMIGASEQPTIENNTINPLTCFGVKVMSMGLLVDEDTPVVWRGPMITKTIQQFIHQVQWGDPEILLIDLPPGTGDAQLSLVQTLPLSGAIIVTTPQAAAVNVAQRGARMFGKVNVPLLGIVENMSFFENPETGERSYLFGRGGGKKAAEALETQVLGEIPLHEDIRAGGDAGVPIVLGQPESQAAKSFSDTATRLLHLLHETAT